MDLSSAADGRAATESCVGSRPYEGIQHVQKHVRKQFPKVQDAWILAHAIVDNGPSTFSDCALAQGSAMSLVHRDEVSLGRRPLSGC